MASLLSWQRWPIAAYDRLFRWLNGLDRPGCQVGPVLRVKVRPSRREVRLMDGTVVRRGDPIGVIHLNNERVASFHADRLRGRATGLEFRRRFLASLRELAALSDLGSLAGVRAFTATTILHHAVARVGFEAARGRSRGFALPRAHAPPRGPGAPRLRAGARQLRGIGAHRRLSARAAGAATTRWAREPARVGPTARRAALAVARSGSGSLPRPGGRDHGEAVRAAYPEPRRPSEKGSSGVTVVRAPAWGRRSSISAGSPGRRGARLGRNARSAPDARASAAP